MTVNKHVRWFSGPQKTIEDAQAFYTYRLFNPAAVFELPDGKGYTLAYIHKQDWPPHQTAQRILDLVGYKMVSCCDPLFGIWKPYQFEEQGNEILCKGSKSSR